MADPVSWMVVETGWIVVGSGDEELGSVHEVLGDEGADIFNGLTVSHGLLRTLRYVPAERVTEIREGRVELDLGRDEFARLEERGPASSQQS
jgi:hypothetical protein